MALRYGKYSCEQPVQFHLGPFSLPRPLGLPAAVNFISSSSRPTMPQPISWYTPTTSAARPKPCLPSTVIVPTLWKATMSSLLRARSRSLLACRRDARRAALLLRLCLLARALLLFVPGTIFNKYSYPRIPALVRARVFGLASGVWLSHPRLAHLTHPSRTWCYLAAPLFPPVFRDGAAEVCLPRTLGRAVLRVGLAEIAPSTPSGALLVDHAI